MTAPFLHTASGASAGRRIRHLTRDDKTLLAAVLLSAGVKARIRVINHGLRLCFVGSQTDVVDALNNNGFRAAGGTPFHLGSFNQPHEVFVRCLEA